MIRAEILPWVRRSEELANGLVWEFERTPAMEAKLAGWVELERQCCGGFDWSLEPRDASNALVLVVEGAGVKELFAASAALRKDRACGC